jgi:starch phosphorylase
MARGRPLEAAGHAYEYAVRIPPQRPAGGYTPRLMPYHPDAAVPLEAPHILWQR